MYFLSVYFIYGKLSVVETVACWFLEGHPGDAQEGLFGS